MNQKIIETKTCKHCWTMFDITDKDREFYDKVSPIFADKKYQIPSPTFCPNCRHQRRLSFRNERKLYHRPSSKTGKSMISMFAPDKEYTVYSPVERYSDARDAREYGAERNSSQSFFSQFDVLLHRVPQIALLGVGNENCDYNNFWWYNKNCYLCFDYGWNEDSAYLSRSYKNKNCLDLSYCAECELSSNLLDCNKCVKSDFCIQCDQGYDCKFCYACLGCSNCFLCSNLANKQFHIFNVSYTKETYEQKVSELLSKWLKALQDEFLSLLSQTIRRYATMLSCENCTGDYLTRCKNCHEVYGAKDSEDCKYVIEPMIVDNLYDDIFSGNSCSYNIETIGCEWSSHLRYCFSCRSSSSDLMYCYFCIWCHHCFGCTGLRNQEYCILNKSYTSEEYEKLVPQIIEKMEADGTWGEFFPTSISPFTYNESLGQEYYPLNKESALTKWFTRTDKEYAINIPAGIELLAPDKLPSIHEVGDEILNQAIICEVSGKPFRIIKNELNYYKRMWFSLPTKHPDVRHTERMGLRNPRKLRDRICMKCWINIKTSYAPERPEMVYCEACYNKEIYW